MTKQFYSLDMFDAGSLEVLKAIKVAAAKGVITDVETLNIFIDSFRSCILAQTSPEVAARLNQTDARLEQMFASAEKPGAKEAMASTAKNAFDAGRQSVLDGLRRVFEKSTVSVFSRERLLRILAILDDSKASAGAGRDAHSAGDFYRMWNGPVADKD